MSGKKHIRHKQCVKEREESVQQFYRSQRWDELWDEFVGARNPDGSLVYPTVWALIKAKFNTKEERTVVYWCIGPKPTKLGNDGTGATMPIKWLGDWQSQRASQFLYSNDKVQTLKSVLDKKLDALEAARGVATVALDWIAKCESWSSQITDAFSGLLAVPGLSPSKLKERAEVFLSLQDKVQKMQTKALTAYLQCNGISYDDVSVLSQMAAVGAKAALAGVKTGAALPEADGRSPFLYKIVDMMIDKAKVYNLEMPEAEFVEAEESHITGDAGHKNGNHVERSANNKNGNHEIRDAEQSSEQDKDKEVVH